MGNVRVVVDTNVWLNYLFFSNTATIKTVRLLFSDKYAVIATEQILEEARNVLSRDKFERLLPLDLRMAFYFEIGELSEIITPTSAITVCRDPKDNIFLEAALDENAGEWGQVLNVAFDQKYINSTFKT